MSGTEGYFLLPGYVVAETGRAILSFIAFRSGVKISTTLVALLSETLKVVVTAIFLIRWIRRQNQYEGMGILQGMRVALLTGGGDDPASTITWRSTGLPLAYTIPACLYLVNNLLYLVGLQLTTVSLLHAIMFAKLPITALLHHIIIRRMKSLRAWLSLLVICAGLFIYASNDIVKGIQTASSSQTPTSLFGPIIGLIIAVISGFASIYTELLMKGNVAFWVAQFWLYFWGSSIALVVALCWDGQVAHLTPHIVIHTAETLQHTVRQRITYHAVVVIATAGVGLITANILRKRDNLIKLVGTSVCVVTILVAQVLLFPELLSVSLTPFVAIGLGLITVGAWVYNYIVSTLSVGSGKAGNGKLAIRSPEEGERLLEEGEGDVALDFISKNEEGIDTKHSVHSDEEDIDSNAGQNAPPKVASWTVPTTPKIAFVLFGWVFLAIAIWATQLNSLPYTSHIDTSRFFKPLDLSPSVWGADLDTHDGFCVSKWVKEQSVTPRSHQLVNIETSHPQNSRCPIYPVPDGGLIFHVFYSGPNRPFHTIVIDAFLATQRLEDGHRLIYWLGENDKASWEGEIERYKKYEGFVEFRVFNPVEEAMGTCLEEMPEYYDEEYRAEKQMPIVAWSDLVRVLLLSKYGGVWLDADCLLLRDLTPLIRMGPVVPGFYEVNNNNNLLIAGPAGSPHLVKLRDTACSLPYDHSQVVEKYPGLGGFRWFWLYNDALFQVCQKYTHCGFTRIPLEWVDAFMKLSDHQDALKPCDESKKPALDLATPPQFHGIFAWHARLNQFDDTCVTDGTKVNNAQVLLRRIREGLESGLDMEGRDLFPGPGYAR